MSLSSTYTNGVTIPLFAGVEDTEQLFIATMDEMVTETQEQISIPHPLFRYLRDTNKIEKRPDIGTYVPVKLVDKENPTVKSMQGYDSVENVPADALSEAKFAYGQIVGTQMYNREEMVKNSGRSQLIDLVETKQEQLLIGMRNYFGNLILGTQDANGRDFMGLGRALAYDQPCGGIDPKLPGFKYWNPKRGLKANGGQFSLSSEFRDGQRKLNREVAYKFGNPDVVVCGEDVYDSYQAWAEGKLQIRIDDLKSQRGWGDFEMFPVNGQTIIYDKGISAKTAWHLNFDKGVKVRIHSGTDFQFQPWQFMENKVAKKRDCLTYAAIYVKNREAIGFIDYQ